MTAANAAPIFDQQDGWQVLEGQLLAFTAFAFDPDNPYYSPAIRNPATGALVETGDRPKTVSVEVIGELPPGATFDPDTLAFRWTPGNAQAGTYTVRLRATDTGDGGEAPLSSEIVVPIIVFNQNRRPAVAAIANVSVAKDTVVEVPVRAFDADGNPLVLGLRNESPYRPVPGFISLIDNGDGTGVLRLAPGANQRGDHVVVVIATDNGDGTGEPLSGGYTFVISVTSPNEAPVIGYIGDLVAVAGQPLTATVRVTDMDQDALSYVVSGLPGATLTPTAVYGQALLSWTPTSGEIGTYDATVAVTDSGSGTVTPASASAAFRVIVRAANAAPQIVPIGPRTVAEGQELAFTLRAADPDGDRPTFAMTGAPDGATLDPATGAFRWTPAGNAAGTYQITFTAGDGNAQQQRDGHADRHRRQPGAPIRADGTPARPGGLRPDLPRHRRRRRRRAGAVFGGQRPAAGRAVRRQPRRVPVGARL